MLIPDHTNVSYKYNFNPFSLCVDCACYSSDYKHSSFYSLNWSIGGSDKPKNLAVAQQLCLGSELTQQVEGKASAMTIFLTLQNYMIRIKVISIGKYIPTYSNTDPFPSIAFHLLYYYVGYLREKLDFRFILGTKTSL